MQDVQSIVTRVSADMDRQKLRDLLLGCTRKQLIDWLKEKTGKRFHTADKYTLVGKVEAIIS